MAAYFDTVGMENSTLHFLLWLERSMLRSQGIRLLVRFYRLWRGRFRRLLASFRSQ